MTERVAIKNRQSHDRFWVYLANDENVFTWKEYKTFGGAYRYVHSWRRPRRFPYWAVVRETIQWERAEGELKHVLDGRRAILAQSYNWPHPTHFKLR